MINITMQGLPPPARGCTLTDAAGVQHTDASPTREGMHLRVSR